MPMTAPAPQRAPAAAATPAEAALAAALAPVERGLAELAAALADGDATATEAAAAALRSHLAGAMPAFAQARRRGPLSAALRTRCAAGAAQVSAQREALARASTAVDQALDILIPQAPKAGTYSPYGRTRRSGSGQIIAAS